MPRLNKELQREREKTVWQYRAEGMTHERIAELIEADRTTVTKMLARLSSRALAELTDEISEEKMAQVSILRHVADEAMQAWTRSKDPEKIVTKRQAIEDAQGGKARGRRGQTPGYLLSRVVDSDGDPRYLDIAMKALGEIRKILGLNAPVNVDMTSAGQQLAQPVTVVEVVRSVSTDSVDINIDGETVAAEDAP